MAANSLLALVVFKNSLYPELIRTVHFYKSEDGVKKVEREYLFYSDSPYEQMHCSRALTLQRFCISEQYTGLRNGVWLCIFVFDADRDCPLDQNDIPTILSIHGNPKLVTIPSLANELRIIFEWKDGTEDGKLNDDVESESKSSRGIDLDLNLVPSQDQESADSDMPSGTVEEKKKRAKPKDVASLSIEDLSKYFDLPILEAAKSLKIGLTVLKKKCRQCGIPRWPHRKIKSLDGLIRDLQEEMEQQKSEDESAAVAVAKRQRLIENEKQTIERKPFLDIRWETKKFRQDIFKKKHRARAYGFHSQTTQQR